MDYKQIKDYNRYIIFKTGKIYSKISKKFIKPYLETHKKTGRKDYRVYLYKNGKKKQFLLARIIGITFIPNLLNLPEIDHIDRNSLNNDLSNLMWATRAENQNNKSIPKNNKLGLRHIQIIKHCKNSYRVRLVETTLHPPYSDYFETEEEAILVRNAYLDFYDCPYEKIDE